MYILPTTPAKKEYILCVKSNYCYYIRIGAGPTCGPSRILFHSVFCSARRTAQPMWLIVAQSRAQRDEIHLLRTQIFFFSFLPNFYHSHSFAILWDISIFIYIFIYYAYYCYRMLRTLINMESFRHIRYTFAVSTAKTNLFNVETIKNICFFQVHMNIMSSRFAAPQ